MPSLFRLWASSAELNIIVSSSLLYNGAVTTGLLTWFAASYLFTTEPGLSLGCVAVANFLAFKSTLAGTMVAIVNVRNSSIVAHFIFTLPKGKMEKRKKGKTRAQEKMGLNKSRKSEAEFKGNTHLLYIYIYIYSPVVYIGNLEKSSFILDVKAFDDQQLPPLVALSN